jgi:fibronectin-binding autotransporter adhesin
MKNTQYPSNRDILQLRMAMLMMAAFLAADLSSAATKTWSGTAGDLKWSTGGNWSGGVPTVTDDALFLTNDAAASAGTVNNIVDGSLSIQSLTFRNTNTWHTMQIDPNVSLTITGSVASPLFVGTGVDSGGTLTVNAAILGSGSLLITNSSGVMNIRQGSPSGGTSSHRATLDMSGLAYFTAYVSRLLVAGDGTSTAAQQREAGTLYLAQTNFIVCAAGSSTHGLGIADGSGNASSGVVYLGQTNVIYSDGGMFVGYRKSPGALSFGSTVVDGSVLFRDRAGSGRQNQWWIGYNTTSGSSVGCNGNVNFTGGTVDALVNTMYVGRSQTTAASGAGVGTLTFSSGTIDVNTLQVGYQSVDGASATGTVNVDGAAQLIVNNNLELGHTTGTTALPKGTLNIGVNTPGGSVWVKGNIVEGGINGDGITVNSGALKVGGTLGSTSLPLQNMTLDNATLTFDLGGAPNPTTALWQVGSLAVTAPVTINVEGYALSLGQFTLIKYATLSGDDGSGFVLGTLPSRVGGYLYNNTANLSLDLVITNAVAPKWAGNVNGDWDINTTTNWVTIVGSKPTTYLENAVPGDPVLFDDTATTTTVNLTTTLSPASITVNNSSKNYTLTGSGRLSGPPRLNKSGAASLTIANTGTNDFAGVVTIDGGKVLISGSANRLPTNSAVTLADAADAILDLNNLDQTLGSLSGGGTSGGNVSLGTGTLNLSAGGGVYHGVISGDGMVVKSGSGNQVFGGANVYGGGTLITGGALIVANTNGSGTGSGDILVATTNAYLQIGDGGTNGSVTASTITNQGRVILCRSDDFTLTKLITGGGWLQQNGTNSVVTIATANTYTGLTYIQYGALRVTHPNALGDTTGVTEIRTDPTARLELAGGITLYEPLTVAQKQTAAASAPAILNVSGTNTLAGPISALEGGSDWTFKSDSGKLIVTGSYTNLATSGGRNVKLRGDAEGEWFSNIGRAASSSVSANLVKMDAGTWTLWGTNTYNANTIISAGLLMVNGQITGSTNISVNGGALGGTGLITAPVTINAGAALSPGGSIGTLTISNKLFYAPSSTCVFDVSASGCDLIRGLTTVTYGGTLQIVLNGALSANAVFKLFDATTYEGAFDFVDVPTLPSPLAWDTSFLLVDGTLRVMGGPAVSSFGLAGDRNFQMSGTGAADQAYRILATTNLAEPFTNWTEVDTGTFAGGVFSFTDVDSTNYTRRFYRVVMP